MLQLSVVIPSRHVLTTSCDDVVLPGFDGEFGVLDAHEQFVTKLGAGILKIKKSSGEEVLVIRGGVVEISQNEITVLADDAKFAHEIDGVDLQKKRSDLSKQLIALSEQSNREPLFEEMNWLNAQSKLVQI